MNEKFQDRIDNYLLNRMNDVEKEAFLHEVEQDADKKEQLEFTEKIKDTISSREEKLQALDKFQMQYEEERKEAAIRATGTDAVCYCPAPSEGEKQVKPKKRIWLWISGVAAVLVFGFFAIKPIFMYESSPNYKRAPLEKMRGGDAVFSPTPTDDADNDTIKFDIEKNVEPNE